jgi:hypothetical protein
MTDQEKTKNTSRVTEATKKYRADVRKAREHFDALAIIAPNTVIAVATRVLVHLMNTSTKGENGHVFSTISTHRSNQPNLVTVLRNEVGARPGKTKKRKKKKGSVGMTCRKRPSGLGASATAPW